MRCPSPLRISLCVTSLVLLASCGDPAETDGATITVGSPQPTVPTAGPSGPIAPTPSMTGPVAPNPVGPTGATGGVAPSGVTPAPAMPTTSGPSAGVGPTPTATGPTSNTPAPTTTGPDTGTQPPAEPQPDVDAQGKGNATPGSSSDIPQDYLRMGDIRILNNNWGSEDLGCFAPTSTMSVFVNEDGSFGWNFNRGDCAAPTDTSHPDFPQVEFGIHPFGIGSDLATSPEFSSTTLLPKQLSDIQSASVEVDSLSINLQNQDSWNITFEFWLSERNPLEPNPGVYAELMTWWGWDAGRWPCGDNMMTYSDRVSAGSLDYTLCHQNDNWASGWRYYQFRAGDGGDHNIRRDFNGRVDVKALLDYLTNQRGYSKTLWLTRMEVGSEIDDNTSGTVSMRGITFEVNGERRSQVIGTKAQ